METCAGIVVVLAAVVALLDEELAFRGGVEILLVANVHRRLDGERTVLVRSCHCLMPFP